MLRNIVYLIVLLSVFFSGFYVDKIINERANVDSVHQQASILLQSIEKVFQIVSVRGHFIEHYDEKKIKEFTLFLPLPETFQFTKKATLEVSGSVLLGFNLENIRINLDWENKIILFDNIPLEAEILAIDHSITFKNIDESWFNSFSAEDYSALTLNAKNVLEQKALSTELSVEALEQRDNIFRMIEQLVIPHGWRIFVQYEDKRIPLDSFLN